jgi:hypothetical protein
MMTGSPVDGDPLQPFERQLLENYPFLAVLMTILLAAPYAKIYEGDLRNWDWLLISGVLVFLVAYPLSLLLPDRVGKALRELQSRGILRPEEAISSFEYRLNILANQWASVGGIALAAVMCLAWLVAFGGTLQASRHTIEFTIPGMLVEMALSIAAGRFIGRGLCYGTLADRLRVEGITFRPIPSHRDGVAGLDPVGRIYFAHAILITLFIAFLSVWIELIPFSGPHYGSWRLPYVGLLVFMLALEVITVFRPLHAFNRILLEWKQEALGNPSISGARMHEHKITASEHQQRFMREQRDRMEQMPTWVLSKAKRWSLAGVNILVMTPFLLAVAGFIQA